MAWVRLDDQFANHPKIESLSDKAFRVFIRGLCYANRYETDGILSLSAQKSLRIRPKIANELVAARLWELKDAGALAIHDYLQYQPSREHRDAIRRVRAEAGAIGGVASGKARSLHLVKQA